MIVVLSAVCHIADGCHATDVADAHLHGIGAKMHEFALGAPARLGGSHAPDRRELSGLPPRLMRSDQLLWSRLQSNGSDIRSAIERRGYHRLIRYLVRN